MWLRWSVFYFDKSAVQLIFNFLVIVCFKMYIENFLTTILEHVPETWSDLWNNFFL